MNNNLLIEKFEEAINIRIASYLRITLHEFNETEFYIRTIESDDGEQYYHQILFRVESPQRILRKIKGLDFNNSIDLPLNIFDI